MAGATATPSRVTQRIWCRYGRGRWSTTLALAIVTSLGSPHPARALVFGSPAALNSNAATDQGLDVTPRVVTDGAGTWLVSWIGSGGDILFSRSTDRGATWTPAAALNPTPASRGGGVQLATDGATWVAVWISGDPLGGTDQDILTARSTDGGMTWTSPQPLNTTATTDTAFDTLPHVATDRAGTWVTVWQSDESLGGTIGSDFDILFARSTDGGMTWTPPAPLNTDAATDAGSDSEPRLATDRNGTWLAVWSSRHPLDGPYGSDADIVVARSTDAGMTWSAPIAVNTNAATDTGDDDLARIATDAAGTWVAIWTSTDSLGGTIGTDEDILVARSTDDGVTWSPPAALNGNAATDVGDDDESELTTDGHGTWAAVWYGDTLGKSPPTDDDIRMARSTDSGATWSFPLPLNDNAARDPWFESDPDIATDGAGTWLAVFDSPDPLGGTIGTDFDILVVRGTEVACTPVPENCGTPAAPPDSVVVLKDRTPDRRDLVLWKWTAPGAPVPADLGDPATGDPLSGTNYRFCIYDGASTLLLGAAAPAGGRCGLRPCWKGIASVKFDYHDRELTPEGINRLGLRAGGASAGKLVVKGTGDNLAMPALGALVLPLRVQLQSGTGACWEATFTTPTENSAAQFRARSD